MRILVLSDAHSNIDALRAVEKAAGNVDRILFLGDMVDYGFFPREVIRWMQEHEALAVMGNHDRRLLELAEQGVPHPADPMQAESFALNNLAQLTGKDLAYLRALPKERVAEYDGIGYYMTHIFPEDEHELLRRVADFDCVALFERYWAEKVGTASLDTPRRIVYGHSHRCTAQMVRRNTMWLNPGSISYRLGPDGCSKGGDYILIQDGEILLRHVDYETGHLYHMAERSGLQGIERGMGLSFYAPETV